MFDLTVHPVYLSARAAIVAPERAIPLTLYATRKWLPRLGPERWCLVLLLRSLSIDSQRRGDGTKRVSCSWRQLAEMLDVHEETVASWLKHKPIPNDKPWRRIIPSDEKAEALALFIPRLRYAYETHNGRTRRIGFLLEVLMEDPVAPEDELRLQKQMEILQLQQGELGLETYRLAEDVSSDYADLPQISKKPENPENLELHYVNQKSSELRRGAKSSEMGLQDTPVNPDILDLPSIVKQYKVGSDSYVNPVKVGSPAPEPEISGKNVNQLDILIQQLKQKNLKKHLRREAFEPVIQMTESLLNDSHSTGMLFKVLNVLYPRRLDLYVFAVRVALDAAETNPQVNRGAVFVRALCDFSEVAGIDLGLNRVSSELPEQDGGSGNRGSHHLSPMPAPASFVAPSVDDAIWAETQLVLRRQMTQATYDAIIQGTVLVGHDNDTYVIGVQTEMAKEWLENRLHDIVQRALSSVVGKFAGVEFRLLSE